MTSGAKVAEIFQQAGVAFSRLGELTMTLQSTDGPGGKWSEVEVEMLRDAVRKFGNDVNRISELLKTKSVHQIRTQLKRKAFREAGLEQPSDSTKTSSTDRDSKLNQSAASETTPRAPLPPVSASLALGRRPASANVSGNGHSGGNPPAAKQPRLGRKQVLSVHPESQMRTHHGAYPDDDDEDDEFDDDLGDEDDDDYEGIEQSMTVKKIPHPHTESDDYSEEEDPQE